MKKRVLVLLVGLICGQSLSSAGNLSPVILSLTQSEKDQFVRQVRRDLDDKTDHYTAAKIRDKTLTVKWNTAKCLQHKEAREPKAIMGICEVEIHTDKERIVTSLTKEHNGVQADIMYIDLPPTKPATFSWY